MHCVKLSLQFKDAPLVEPKHFSRMAVVLLSRKPQQILGSVVILDTVVVMNNKALRKRLAIDPFPNKDVLASVKATLALARAAIENTDVHVAVFDHAASAVFV